MPKATRRTLADETLRNGDTLRITSTHTDSNPQPISAVYEIERADLAANKDPTGIRGEIHDWHHKLSRVTGTLVLAYGRRGFKKAELVQFSRDLRQIADRFDQISGLTDYPSGGPIVGTVDGHSQTCDETGGHHVVAETENTSRTLETRASRANSGNRVRPKARGRR